MVRDTARNSAFALASPRAAAEENQAKARIGLRATPWPLRYITPSTSCAFGLPARRADETAGAPAHNRRGYRPPCRLPRGLQGRPGAQISAATTRPPTMI